MRALVWLRRDLRISDNTAFIQACQQADEVIAIYIATPKTWQSHDKAPRQIALTYARLTQLSQDCAVQHAPLLFREVDYFSDTPALLHEVMQHYQCDALYFNREYEWDELRRDAKVVKYLKQYEVTSCAYDDQTVVPPGILLNQSQQPYKVFTPFKKCWLAWVGEHGGYWPLDEVAKPKKLNIVADAIPVPDSHIVLDDWPVTEQAIHQRLQDFCRDTVDHYHAQRNIPSEPGTSRLSAYLALGMLSPRQCAAALLEAGSYKALESIPAKSGAAVWLSELIWREFYKHIMYHFPRVSRDQPFLLDTNQVSWSENNAHFKAWCEGNTGVPIVDAAMRCLNQTGWMHNRLRMVVAMFLTKNLFIDWRRGEAYFMQQLFDGDLSANNGGWQWSASTGTDAAPYFRIFNPVSQSERFDPEGAFIRKYCPELSGLDNKAIHQPHNVAGYPEPLVDLKASRQQAIDAFKSILKK